MRDSFLNRLEAPGQRIPNSDAQSDLRRVVGLPVLKPLGVPSDLVRIRAGPACSVEIQKRWFHSFDHALAGVEKACPSRTPQVLSARRCKHVAADGVHIDGHLTD